MRGREKLLVKRSKRKWKIDRKMDGRMKELIKESDIDSFPVCLTKAKSCVAIGNT